MQLSGTDFYRAYRPSECDLRVYLHHKGIKAADPGPYEEVIRRLGDRHEKKYLATLQGVVDLTQGTSDERQVATREAIRAGAAVIYQPMFAATFKVAGQICEVVGIPDFLIREGEKCLIRDVKMTRRIAEHPEILWQLRLYGWLFERATGRPPLRLEVFNGRSELIAIEPEPVEDTLARLAVLIADTDAPFEPVGWSRCGGCGYNERCWSEAKAHNDVAMVLKVDKGLARALRSINVVSYDDLLTEFDEATLSAFEKPWGKTTQKVGNAAKDILLSARALQTKLPIPLGPVLLPANPNFLMFDLEGLPPHLDDLEKIYLWGMQVYGERPSEYMAAMAGFSANGDKDGWDKFLACAGNVMAEHGPIPFVHWSHYEKTKINLYIKRHGDPNGIGASVLNNLFDLLPVAQAAVMLPLPSYSLKVVEQYVGFKRTQDEYGGAWSMAQYIEATEIEDQDARQKVMDTILKYNKEDLAATWAVLVWLRDFGQVSSAR